MSNHLAIATVTATLRRTLQGVLDVDVPGATATAVRPQAASTATPTVGVNLFLYQVTPNAAFRNGDLPTRRGDGQLVQRPRVALDLHYIFTFYGDDTLLEPQIVLGSVARALHAQPSVTAQMVHDTVNDPSFVYLAGSDLEEAVESVRVTPSALTLEELSKLWSVFFQTSYTLSTAYQASLVLIEGRAGTARALPVRAPLLFVAPTSRPFLTRVLSQSAAGQPIVLDQPILAGYRLVLEGRELSGVGRVRFGDVDTTPLSVAPEQVVVVLPPGLPAGAHAVEVHQDALLGEPLVVHPGAGAGSNPLSFVLRPTITAALVAGELDVSFDPPVEPEQEVSVLLNQVAPPPGVVPRSFTLAAPARGALPDPKLTFDLAGVSPGTYVVRAVVDGAESTLAFNAALGRYDAPEVVV